MTDFQSPNFEFPPVIEVVLSVQFEPLNGLKITQLGKLHSIFESDYPNVSEHNAIDPKFENFDSDPLRSNQITLKLVDTKDMPRVWFSSKDGNKLIQFQRDRFVNNWRRDDPLGDVSYPRYEPLRNGFEKSFQKFLNFLDELKLPKPAINQIEVSYVNMIECNDIDFTKSLHDVFKFWNPDPPSSPLGEPESQKFFNTYFLKDENDIIIGRLHMVSHVVNRSDNKKFLRIDFTARGKPKEVSLNGIIEFMNLCRGKIVSGFESLTTEKMHEIWGKK